MLLSGLSVQSIICEGSLRVASPLYCVSRWNCNRPWESEGGSSMCAGLCASSSIHTEKPFLWDWNRHIEHCRWCRKRCSAQIRYWPLGSNWGRGWPRYSRFLVVSEKSRAAKDGSQRYTGAMFLVQKLLQHQLLVRLHPARLFISLMLLRWEMLSVLRSILSFVSFVTLDLCQAPEKVRGGKASAKESCCCKKMNSVLKVRLLAVFQLKLLSKNVLRSRVREEVVAIFALPRLSKGDTNNNLFFLYV